MVVSFDINTKFIAYAVFDGNDLKEHGRLILESKYDDRIGSVATVVYNKFEPYDITAIVYENGFLANSPKTLIELSKINGALVGGMRLAGVVKSIAVPPITWQLGIGVGRTSIEDMERLNEFYAGKSVSWIKNKNRENRKQLIIDYVNSKYSLTLDMNKNDEADAIALGHYAINKYGLE